MCQFMRKGAGMALRVAERAERRHLDVIGDNAVVGTVTSLADDGSSRREEALGMCDSFAFRGRRRDRWVDMRR
jgi:hypothetical protein